MSESTRRQFLQVAGTGRRRDRPRADRVRRGPFGARRRAPGLPKQSVPVGPTAPYAGYQSEIYISGMTAGVKPIFTTNLSDLEAAAAQVLPEAARRHLLA